MKLTITWQQIQLNKSSKKSQLKNLSIIPAWLVQCNKMCSMVNGVWPQSQSQTGGSSFSKRYKWVKWVCSKRSRWIITSSLRGSLQILDGLIIGWILCSYMGSSIHTLHFQATTLALALLHALQQQWCPSQLSPHPTPFNTHRPWTLCPSAGTGLCFMSNKCLGDRVTSPNLSWLNTGAVGFDRVYFAFA